MEDQSKCDTEVKEEFILWKEEKISIEQRVSCCQAIQHQKGNCSIAYPKAFFSQLRVKLSSLSLDDSF